MTAEPSNPDAPHSPSSPPQGQAFEREWEPEESPGEASWGDRSTVALDMARMWVKDHQRTTMLGAFAVGVFVGALFRE